MIYLKRNGWQLIIMVKDKELKNTLIKLFFGLIIYFAIINIVILFRYGTLFTPLQWLFNPLYNLFIKPNMIAWFILLISEMIGWFFFERQ